jgi:hypothetical protein
MEINDDQGKEKLPIMVHVWTIINWAIIVLLVAQLSEEALDLRSPWSWVIAAASSPEVDMMWFL